MPDFLDPFDGAPEITVDEEKGTVAIKGETAQPSQETPAETLETPAPEPEPSKPEGTEETVELNPIEKAFIERGLDKQFKGGLEEAIERIPDMNKYITTLEQQNALLRRIAEQPQAKAPEPTPEPQFEPDKFFENPYPALDGRYVRQDDVAAIRQELEAMKAQTFMQSKPDFQKMAPAMTEILAEHPNIQKLPTVEALSLLYDAAKARQIPAMVAEASKKSSATTGDKQRAETDVKGTLTKKTTTRTLDDWVNMKPEEIEKEIGVVNT